VKDQETRLLRLVASGLKLPRRRASNVLTNAYWETLVRGSLKGLEKVALESMDWKLTALVKLLQSWLTDQEEEKRDNDFGYYYRGQSLVGHNKSLERGEVL